MRMTAVEVFGQARGIEDCAVMPCYMDLTTDNLWTIVMLTCRVAAAGVMVAW